MTQNILSYLPEIIEPQTTNLSGHTRSKFDFKLLLVARNARWR